MDWIVIYDGDEVVIEIYWGDELFDIVRGTAKESFDQLMGALVDFWTVQVIF